jgi:hypothetical protein
MCGASILELGNGCNPIVVYTVYAGLDVHAMISPDLSIGDDPFLIMLTWRTPILCFTLIKANPKINLPDSAACVVISVGA